MTAQSQTNSSTDQSAQVSAWNLANLLTVVRLALVPLFADLLMQSRTQPSAAYQAAYVFILASATDLADGVIARRFNLVTNFGKIADPIADKALIGTALIGLSIMGEIPWLITGAILIREVGITLLRLRLIRRAVIPASRGGKVKTVSQIIAITLVILPVPDRFDSFVTLTLWLALILTLATGVDYVARAISLIRSPASNRTAYSSPDTQVVHHD